jgi:NADH-quinone oxidoreductase subunit F
MLRDQDRIFSNLYGDHSPLLDGARERGDWDGTAGLIGKGRGWLVDEMKASGLRGRADLSRGQCGRVRARHLQGP